ncbi:gamma carbonic anhydrase family protein [Halopenitus salinus]|uniref:Gamma carbonic anhydrase family protein n=1 Tax=Halopenitus salinus TaxID=1198295 RepID=A0ABD5UXL4_9EURY
MNRSIRGSTPEIDDSAFVSEMSYVVGDVTVEENASVWPFVCLRGDGGEVTIGEDSNVQEFSMIHGSDIGDRVTVGHGVVIDYSDIGDDSLIGISSVVLEGATVESNSIVAAGSVVRHDQIIPEGHVAYGIPAETRPITDEQREEIRRIQEHYVELGAEYRDQGTMQ